MLGITTKPLLAIPLQFLNRPHSDLAQRYARNECLAPTSKSMVRFQLHQPCQIVIMSLSTAYPKLTTGVPGEGSSKTCSIIQHIHSSVHFFPTPHVDACTPPTLTAGSSTFILFTSSITSPCPIPLPIFLPANLTKFLP